MAYPLLHVSFDARFFFQAEDGIRDGHVTGVQTCALPIFRNHGYMIYDTLFAMDEKGEVKPQMVDKYDVSGDKRSEERRVGKESTSRGEPYRDKIATPKDSTRTYSLRKYFGTPHAIASTIV